MQLLKSDPRYFQIFALSSLFCFLLLLSDFGPSQDVLILNIMTASLVQVLCWRIFLKEWRFDLKSPIITSLSLTLLLKTASLWLVPVAAALAILSKFTLRIKDKHLFNPANFGIVALLVFVPEMAWVSPAQWGREIWTAFLLACLAIPVLGNARRFDTAFFFILCFGGMLLLRNVWLGDPFEIFIHQIMSGALLIFTFFMITDPKSTPDHRIGRFVFALLVALASYIMTFFFQIREAVFFALFGACLCTPFIDMFFKSPRYQWRIT